MRKTILIGFLVLILSTAGGCGKSLVEVELENGALNELSKIEEGFYSITSQEISDFIWFLAGPECEGRRNGTEGSKKAGRFLMEELENYSLDQHFFQGFSSTEIIRDRQYGDRIVAYYGELGFEVNENGRNVVGILEGTDKKEEYVIISAHYDHVGMNENGEVFPGADDNASGASAVLEIAEAFGILAKGGIRPERSIIFVFFDAEEMGLWGSQYFVQNPPVPFENIVAVVNLDMIGRNKPNELQVIGSKNIKDFSERSPQLYWATIRANKILGFELVYPPARRESHQRYRFFASDQSSFYLASPEDNRLPVVFYHADLHDDYHMPSDTPEKVNFEKVRNVARFSFFVVWQIANLEEKPTYQD